MLITLIKWLSAPPRKTARRKSGTNENQVLGLLLLLLLLAAL